jgi:hypothetical protein
MEDLETGITAIRRKTEGQQMWGVAMPLKPRNLKKNRKMLRNWLLQLVGAKRAPRKLLLEERGWRLKTGNAMFSKASLTQAGFLLPLHPFHFIGRNLQFDEGFF